MANLLFAAASEVQAAHAAAEAGHGAEEVHGAGAIIQELIEHNYDQVLIQINWHPFGLEWLDLSITKVTINLWIAAFLILILFRALAAKQAGDNKKGRYLNFLEPFVL